MPKTPERDLAEEIDETTAEGYMMKAGIDPDAAREAYEKKLDLDKIAASLDATRKGAVPARSGHIGAVETLAAVQAIQAEEKLKKSGQ